MDDRALNEVSARSGSVPAWPAAGPSRVPAWIYSDPEIFRRERETIFRGRSWNYVALSCEVAQPGDFKRSSVADMPVVVARDEAGGVNVFVNRCAHRGVEFCRAARGNAREFMCPYHQWTFSLKGDLTAVPFRKGYRPPVASGGPLPETGARQRQGGMPADFRLEDHGLETLAVTERNGVIFASFDPSTEPFEDYLGDKMLRYFDRVFDGRELHVLGYMRQTIPANWKLYVDNQKDPYHATLLHYFLISFGLFRASEPSLVRMDALGRHSALVSQRGEQKEIAGGEEMKHNNPRMALAGPQMLQPVREFKGAETVVLHTIWPSLVVQQQSNTLATRHIIPRGPGAYELAWTFFGYADDDAAMTERRLMQANLMGPAGYVSVDDSEVVAFAQDGLAPYGGSVGVVEMDGREVNEADTLIAEGAVRGFYDHYRRVMGL
jgi:salicylate 5-hydroxylase large subunit